MWFYVRDKQKVGPLSPQQLKEHATAGNLRPADLVMRKGNGEKWVPAKMVKGLFSTLANGHQPLAEAGAAHPGRARQLARNPWVLAGVGIVVLLVVAGVVAMNSGTKPVPAPDKSDKSAPVEQGGASATKNQNNSQPAGNSEKPEIKLGAGDPGKKDIQPVGNTKRPENLLGADDLKYLGLFLLPDNGTNGTSRFPYGGSPVAFNPHGNGGKGSLFIGGHDHHQLVAEVSIPEVINSKQMNELKTAQLLQPFGDHTGGLKGLVKSGNQRTKLGGMLVYKNSLLWTVYQSYNVEGNNWPSHGVSDLDLSKPNAKGLWYIDNFHVQKTGGYMCLVPKSWQKEFGFPLLTGLQKSQGRATSSEGPAAFGFDPWASEKLPENKAKLKAKQLLWYDVTHPSEYTCDDVKHTWKGANTVAGMAFPVTSDGNKSALVYMINVGLHKTDWYGEPQNFPGPRNPKSVNKGYHAPPYKMMAWFYDPSDLLKVADGKAEPFSIKPYLQVDISSHFFSQNLVETSSGYMSYDPATRRIFIAEFGVDRKNKYESWPVVHVYQVP